MKTLDDVDEYRHLFYWYRYQFYIRSESFLKDLEARDFFELWSDESHPFYYIARLAMDPDAHLEDLPFAVWRQSNIAPPRKRGRPRKKSAEELPVRKSLAVLYDGREVSRWGEFIITDFLRKAPGGKKNVGDILIPFPRWSRCLLIFDNADASKSRLSLAREINSKTFTAAEDAGIGPKSDFLTKISAPPHNPVLDKMALFREPTDVSNLRAGIRDALKEAHRLILSASQGEFPW